jgi:hypothetical protein
MSKNRMTGGGAGGGPGSKSLARVNQYFTGQPSTRVSPKGVSQLGSSMGNHATGSSRVLPNPGTPLKAGAFGGPGSTELGNSCAVGTVCKPGGSRTIHPTAGQAQHGPVAGTVRPPGRSFDDRSK